MKISLRLKFLFSFFAVSGIVCITPFISSYSTQTNKFNFQSQDNVKTPPFSGEVNVSQFGIGVAPTSRKIEQMSDAQWTTTPQYFLDNRIQETPFQFGYMDKNWFNTNPTDALPFALSFPGAASDCGSYDTGTKPDPKSFPAANLMGNQFNFINNSSVSDTKYVDLSNVTTLDYDGAPAETNPNSLAVPNIYYANPVLDAYNDYTHNGTFVPDYDTDTNNHAHFTVPYDWPDSASTSADTRLVTGKNPLLLSFPLAWGVNFAPRGADSSESYLDWRYNWAPVNPEIYPTQLDFLSEDSLNYAARYNANGGYTNDENAFGDKRGKMFTAEAACSNRPTFYKPSWQSDRSDSSTYNTLKAVAHINITDKHSNLREIGFNCFGGQYRYSGYFDDLSKSAPYIANGQNQIIKHSFKDPLSSIADDYGYDTPDAFIGLNDVTIDDHIIDRIHSGAFYGGLNPRSKTSRDSLLSVDFKNTPITYMDNNDGPSPSDKDDKYWKTHCPDPDFSPLDAKKGDPDFMGGIFENNSRLNKITFNGCIESDGLPGHTDVCALTDIPSRCFYGDTALTGLNYTLEGNSAPSQRIPQRVTYIGADAFNNSGWTQVILPNNSTYKLDPEFLGGQATQDTVPRTLTFTEPTTDQNRIRNLLTTSPDRWKQVFQQGKEYTINVPWSPDFGTDISNSPYYKVLNDYTSKVPNLTVHWNYIAPYDYKIINGIQKIQDTPMELSSNGNTSALPHFQIALNSDIPNSCTEYLKKLVPEFCDATGAKIDTPSGWSFSAIDDSLSFYINYTSTAISIDQPVYVRATWDSSSGISPPSSDSFDTWAKAGFWHPPGGFAQSTWFVNKDTTSTTSSNTSRITAHASYSSHDPVPDPISMTVGCQFTGTPGNTSWTPYLSGYFYPITGPQVKLDNFPSFVAATVSPYSGNQQVGSRLKIELKTDRDSAAPGTYSFKITWKLNIDENIQAQDPTQYSICLWNFSLFTMSSSKTSQFQQASAEELGGAGLPINGLGLSYGQAATTINVNQPADPFSFNDIPFDYEKVSYDLKATLNGSSHALPAWLTQDSSGSVNPAPFQIGFDQTKNLTTQDVGSWNFTLTVKSSYYDSQLSATLNFTFTLQLADGFSWGKQGSKTWTSDESVREYTNTAYTGTDLTWTTMNDNKEIYLDTSFTAKVTDDKGVDKTSIFFPNRTFPETPSDGTFALTWQDQRIAPGEYSISVSATNGHFPGRDPMFDTPVIFDVWQLDTPTIAGGPSDDLKDKIFSSGVASSSITPSTLAGILQADVYLTKINILGSTGSTDPSSNFQVTYSTNSTMFSIDKDQSPGKYNAAHLSWNNTTTTGTQYYTPQVQVSTGRETQTAKFSTSQTVQFVSDSDTSLDDSAALDTWSKVDKSVLSGQVISNNSLNFSALTGSSQIIPSDCTWTIVDDTVYADQSQTKLSTFVFCNDKGMVSFGNAPNLNVGASQEYSFHLKFSYKYDDFITSADAKNTFRLQVYSSAPFTTNWNDNIFDKDMSIYSQPFDPQNKPLWNIVTTPSVSPPDRYGYGIFGYNDQLISYYGNPGDKITSPVIFSGSTSGLVVTPNQTDTTQNASLDDTGVNVNNSKWSQYNLLQHGSLSFYVVVFGITSDGTIISSSDNSPTATINFTQLTDLTKFKYANSKYDVNINSTDTISSSSPTFDFEYDPQYAPVTPDPTRSDFFLNASNNANDFSVNYVVTKNGKEISASDLEQLYPKLHFSQNQEINNSEYYGKINFAIVDKISKSEQAKYKGTWQVTSTLSYNQYSSPNKFTTLSIPSNSIEFDLNPPSKTGVIVGMIAGGIAGTTILALVVHSFVRKAKNRKAEREDEKEEKTARNTTSSTPASHSSSTGF